MSTSWLTKSELQQITTETQVADIYDRFYSEPLPQAKTLMLTLRRDQHVGYLTQSLKHLGHAFKALDATRPWLCYWILHSLALLGESASVDCELEDHVVEFLNRCRDPHGGYGGGPGQMPHLATTYAAVNSLVTIGGEKALSSVDREELRGYLLRMKDPSGGFTVHDGGEIDVRAVYLAVSVASVVGILDGELAENVGDYVLRCQTYEGGISGEPGAEAHGAYTYCGLAAMILIGEADRLDLAGLLDWVVFRQGVECGFQGRVNKLVDGCYSFWQGAVLAMIQRVPAMYGECLQLNGSGTSTETKFSDIGASFMKGHAELDPLFHSVGLQQYLLLCSQVEGGGFRDKPGAQIDQYHTCYCLSGLAVSQHCWSKDDDSLPSRNAVFGPWSNLLEPVHPLYDVVLDRYYKAHDYFSGCQSA